MRVFAKRMIKLEPKGVRALESYKGLLLEIQVALSEAHVGMAVA